MVPVADQLLDVGRDERYSLRVVQLQAAGETPLGEEAEVRDCELVELSFSSVSVGEKKKMG